MLFAIATHSQLGQSGAATWSFAMGQIIRLPVSPAGYPDTVATLNPAENVLLVAIRGWVAACRKADDPMPPLRQELTRAGAPEAAISIDALMAIIGRTARQPIEVRCPRCPKLAIDEKHILHAAWAAQERRVHHADGLLRGALLLGEGAAFALGPLEGIAVLFAKAGLVFPQRRPGAADEWPIGVIQAWTPSMSSVP
jgi:hypothetical protein